MKTTSCTEKKRYAFDNARRCGARTKRNNGDPCRSPAIRNKKRCRIHGGASGSGGQLGNSNALKHGYSTKEVKVLKQQIKRAIMISDELIKST